MMRMLRILYHAGRTIIFIFQFKNDEVSSFLENLVLFGCLWIWCTIIPSDILFGVSLIYLMATSINHSTLMKNCHSVEDSNRDMNCLAIYQVYLNWVNTEAVLT